MSTMRKREIVRVTKVLVLAICKNGDSVQQDGKKGSAGD